LFEKLRVCCPLSLGISALPKKLTSEFSDASVLLYVQQDQNFLGCANPYPNFTAIQLVVLPFRTSRMLLELISSTFDLLAE